MKLTSKWLLAAILACALIAPTLAMAAKKYQVTGKVLEVTDKMIVVQKPNEERWEIDRDANTKITGDLKVGEKVTIEYRMTATSVDVKGDKVEKGDKAEKPAPKSK